MLLRCICDYGVALEYKCEGTLEELKAKFIDSEDPWILIDDITATGEPSISMVRRDRIISIILVPQQKISTDGVKRILP